MIKQIFFFLFSIMLLAGCEDADVSEAPDTVKSAESTQSVKHVDTSVDKEQRSQQSEDAGRSLDLRVTPEMMEQVIEKDEGVESLDDVLTADNTFAPRSKKNERRINVKGEVYFDKTQQDYMNAIEGGKVDVELRFQE